MRVSMSAGEGEVPLREEGGRYPPCESKDESEHGVTPVVEQSRTEIDGSAFPQLSF